jgi:hypothetical protein
MTHQSGCEGEAGGNVLTLRSEYSRKIVSGMSPAPR